MQAAFGTKFKMILMNNKIFYNIKYPFGSETKGT